MKTLSPELKEFMRNLFAQESITLNVINQIERVWNVDITCSNKDFFMAGFNLMYISNSTSDLYVETGKMRYISLQGEVFKIANEIQNSFEK